MHQGHSLESTSSTERPLRIGLQISWIQNWDPKFEEIHKNHVYSCVFMDIHGCSQGFMDIHRYSQIFMDIHRYSYVFIWLFWCFGWNFVTSDTSWLLQCASTFSETFLCCNRDMCWLSSHEQYEYLNHLDANMWLGHISVCMQLLCQKHVHDTSTMINISAHMILWLNLDLDLDLFTPDISAITDCISLVCQACI